MESGRSVEASYIQRSLVLPTGEVIIAKEYSTVATLEHSGTYSCIAFVNDALTVVNFTVFVYGKTIATILLHSYIYSYITMPRTKYNSNSSSHSYTIYL